MMINRNIYPNTFDGGVDASLKVLRNWVHDYKELQYHLERTRPKEQRMSQSDIQRSCELATQIHTIESMIRHIEEMRKP